MAFASGEVRIEELILKTEDRALPEMTFFLRLPEAKSGTEENAPEVSRVWIFFTHLTDPKNLKPVLQGEGIGGAVVRFADQRNIAILSCTTTTVYSIQQSEDEMKKQIESEQEERFDSLSRTIFRALSILTEKFKLPRKPYLISGSSRGGQWAHRLALEAPDRFLAVHADINSSYDVPDEKAKNLFWMITTGELEYGYKAGIRFYQKARALGFPIVFKARPKVGHSIDSRNISLGLEFFDFALSQEESTNRSDLFQNSPFWGDLLNQSISPKMEEIPENFRVPLPTENLKDLWK